MHSELADPRTTSRPQRPRRQIGSIVQTTLRYVLLAIGGAVMIIPFLWMLTTSLKTPGAALTVPPEIIPSQPTLDSYRRVLETVPLARMFGNSLVVTAISVTSQLVTSLLAAYAFARMQWRGRNVVFLLYLATLMVPSQVTITPLFIMMQRLGWVFVPLLAIAALAALAGAPATPDPTLAAGRPGLLTAVFADRRFRRLLIVLAVGGIASAIPATLVLFFIADVLRLAEWQGLFLVIYFVCGGIALPGWVALARRHGKILAWAASMVLAIASFVWAFLLDAGDGVAFGLICAASGAALGAELALPPALLADRLADGRRAGNSAAGAGAYFGVWNFVTKFNLALAAGIALPLVSLGGYQVGAGDTAPTDGLLALAAIYALLPAAIKVISLLLLWRWKDDFEGAKP